jgi:hypothetical protein
MNGETPVAVDAKTLNNALLGFPAESRSRSGGVKRTI